MHKVLLVSFSPFRLLENCCQVVSGLTSPPPVNFSTRSPIETNQPCTKSLRKLMRSGLTKGNGTSSEAGRSGKGESVAELQKVRSPLKSVMGKTSSNAVVQDKEGKKRKRRKHKGKRRERNKEARSRKEKHERRKATGKFVRIKCKERIKNHDDCLPWDDCLSYKIRHILHRIT